MRETIIGMPTEAQLRDLLVGKSVVQAEMDTQASWPTGTLTLSDGTVLKVWGNDGGCSCTAGCYPLTELNACENLITNVQVDGHPHFDESCPDHPNYEDSGYYRVFVVAEDRQITLASFEGTDGNGYYGTGWWLQIVPAQPSDDIVVP